MRRGSSIIIESNRIDLNYPAWIETAYGVMSCTLLQISTSSAHILFAEDRPLSPEFALWLTRNGACRRHCRLLKRVGSRLLVELKQEPLVRLRTLGRATFGPLESQGRQAAM